MAKTDKWRSIYALARATRTPIFSGPIVSWNKNQIEFSYWCEFYYSISQDAEKPDEKIIQDDFALDAWLLARKMKIRTEQIKQKSNTFNNSSGRVTREQETFEF